MIYLSAFVMKNIMHYRKEKQPYCVTIYNENVKRVLIIHNRQHPSIRMMIFRFLGAN